MLIPRRQMHLGAAAAAPAAVATSAHAADICKLPTQWDKTVDVIVIGAGGAGLTAGIFAKEAGANAVVLEKMPFPGGNTMICGGGINAAIAEDSKAAGVEDSPALHAKQTLAAGDFRAAPELVETLAAGAPESVA